MRFFTAISLLALQVDLWLVFGLLAFWLNFIPNVGTVLAVALPMPIVIIDPSFSVCMHAYIAYISFSVTVMGARNPSPSPPPSLSTLTLTLTLTLALAQAMGVALALLLPLGAHGNPTPWLAKC